MSHRRQLMATSALVATIFASAAHAQTSSATTIEELVVTAEKREQSLQDVPVAVSAYTSEARDLVGINSVQDMTNFTPGLTYNNSGDRITLRGVGRISNVQAADGAVAIYSDGIFTSSTFEASKPPLFIDRVEVLRGPQGTLYGRNSIGGAINVISKRPTEEFEAEVRATVGNYNYTLFQGTVSGPLSDSLRYRVNGSWEKQRDGYYDNIVPGMPDEGNVIDQSYLEFQLDMDFGDNFEGWVKVSRFEWNNGGGGLGGRAAYTPSPYNTTQEAPSVFFLNQGYAFSGQVLNVVNPSGTSVNPAINDPFKFATNTASTVSLDETFVLAAEFTYHFENMDLRYIGGGANYHYTLIADNDGGPVNSYTVPVTGTGTCSAAFVAAGICAPLTIFPKAITNYQEDKDWLSNELNLTSTHDGPFQWLVGAYYYHEAYKQPVSVQLPNQPQFAAPVNGPANLQRFWYDTRPDFEARSYAAFGQIDWQFTDTLKLTAGLRYSHDHKFGQEEARLVCFALAACGTSPQLLGTFTPAVDITAAAVGTGRRADGTLLPGVSKATVIDPVTGLAKRVLDASWQATTGTIGVDWKPNDDILAYAKYSKGYKAGGFNSGIVAPVVTNVYTDKESNNAYEVGFKWNLGRTFQANVSAFYYDYQNFQAPVTIVNTSGGVGTAQTLFFNIPKAISKGFEIETVWTPIDNLRLLANYSYNDAYIDEASGIIDSSDPTAVAPGARPVGAPSPTVDIYTGRREQGQELSGNTLPQANALGISVQQLGAAYAQMTLQGVSASQAETQ
ncbi:TonB-dependent receptor domain-containing protein, partial [Phenylobacterium sp.]|uniref:TonB-dependent receptor n=1 Tax=Phenylobacterium sp. TaxID=1871053 RepID=UPI00286CE251